MTVIANNSLITRTPVNLLVTQDDPLNLRIAMNGNGKADIIVRRAASAITLNDKPLQLQPDAEGHIRLPLQLEEPAELKLTFQP